MKKQLIWMFVAVVGLGLLTFACGGGKKKIVNSWSATELTLGDTKIAASDLGGVAYAILENGTFSYTESGKTEQGKWSLSDDAKVLLLNFDEGGRSLSANLVELTDDKCVLAYEEHGMKRTITLAAEKKP